MNGQHTGNEKKNNENDINDNDKQRSRFWLSRDGATAQQVTTEEEYGDGAYQRTLHQPQEER